MEYLNEKDTAKYIGVARITLKVWRSKKLGLPFFKTDTGLIRYSKIDIDRYMESHKVVNVK